jgi:hypothetical protein
MCFVYFYGRSIKPARGRLLLYKFSRTSMSWESIMCISQYMLYYIILMLCKEQPCYITQDKYSLLLFPIFSSFILFINSNTFTTNIRVQLQHPDSTVIHIVPKIRFMIPSNETGQPRSQFLHSCICERFMYSQDQSAYLAAET